MKNPRQAAGETAYSMNSEDTDSSLLMRRMVSASSEDTDTWRMRAQARASSRSGMVSVTTSSSSSESSMRDTAAPDSTAWVQYESTRLAPFAFSASAALHRVPAVSTMSSMMMQ